MARPRKHKSDTARTNAYKAAKMERIVIDVRKDGPMNKSVIKEAANELELPLAAFIMQAIAKHILDQLGPEWLEEARKRAHGVEQGDSDA